MEAIGIIFFACLAFAIAILILITCCFFKVNGGKDSKDLEMSKSNTIRRMHQIGYNKSVNGEVSKQNPNVILLINKKNKYSTDPTISKENLNNSNRHRRIEDVDGVIDESYQNDAGHQNDGDHLNDNDCNESSNHVPGDCHLNHVNNSGHGLASHGSILQSHGNSNHDFGGTHHQSHVSHHDHGIGHFNEGFSSHFSSSHRSGGGGHHSGDDGHHGCHDDTGGVGDD